MASFDSPRLFLTNRQVLEVHFLWYNIVGGSIRDRLVRAASRSTYTYIYLSKIARSYNIY